MKERISFSIWFQYICIKFIKWKNSLLQENSFFFWFSFSVKERYSICPAICKLVLEIFKNVCQREKTMFTMSCLSVRRVENFIFIRFWFRGNGELKRIERQQKLYRRISIRENNEYTPGSFSICISLHWSVRDFLCRTPVLAYWVLKYIFKSKNLIRSSHPFSRK